MYYKNSVKRYTASGKTIEILRVLHGGSKNSLSRVAVSFESLLKCVRIQMLAAQKRVSYQLHFLNVTGSRLAFCLFDAFLKISKSYL